MIRRHTQDFNHSRSSEAAENLANIWPLEQSIAWLLQQPTNELTLSVSIQSRELNYKRWGAVGSQKEQIVTGVQRNWIRANRSRYKNLFGRYFGQCVQRLYRFKELNVSPNSLRTLGTSLSTGQSIGPSTSLSTGLKHTSLITSLSTSLY